MISEALRNRSVEVIRLDEATPDYFLWDPITEALRGGLKPLHRYVPGVERRHEGCEVRGERGTILLLPVRGVAVVHCPFVCRCQLNTLQKGLQEGTMVRANGLSQCGSDPLRVLLTAGDGAELVGQLFEGRNVRGIFRLRTHR